MSEKPCDQGHYHEVERQAWECLKRDLAAEKAENKRLQAERDRQYDENVNRIAAQGKAELRAETLDRKVHSMANEVAQEYAMTPEEYIETHANLARRTGGETP